MKHGYPYYWQDGIQQQEDVLSSLMGLSETSGTLTRVSQSLGITKEQAKLIKICSHQYCAQIHSPIWPLLIVGEIQPSYRGPSTKPQLKARPNGRMEEVLCETPQHTSCFFNCGHSHNGNRSSNQNW